MRSNSVCSHSKSPKLRKFQPGTSQALLLSLFLAAMVPAFSANPAPEAVSLNNDGVKALNQKDYDTAIEKFKQSLQKSPGYKYAHDNLAIAYNNVGISVPDDHEKSLKAFHMSMWLNPANKTTQANLNGAIKFAGKNPKSFEDRVALADQAVKDNDFAAAIVEYTQALSIRDDANVRKKLADVKIPSEWQAATVAPAIAAADVDFGPYMADMQRRVKRAWFPPKGNESKRVVMLWKIKKDGTVTDVKVDKSSGVKPADEAAVTAVKNASPFRPLPTGSPDVVDIQFTFDYNVFNNSGTPDEARLKQDIADAQKEGDNLKLARALVQLGNYYDGSQTPDQATSIYKRALELLTNKVEDRMLQAKADTALGDIYYAKNDYENALPLYKESLDIRQGQNDNPRDLTAARRDLAYTLLYKDDEHADEAMELFKTALPTAEELRGTGANFNNDDQELLVDIRYGIGHCHWANGEYANALADYQWVLPETKKLDGDESARVLQRTKDIADCQYQLGNLKEALPIYKQVAAMAERVSDADQNEVEEAKSHIDEISEKLGIPSQQEIAQQAETKKTVNKAYSWLPYALGGALLSLLIIALVGNRQNSEIDIAGRNNKKTNS